MLLVHALVSMEHACKNLQRQMIATIQARLCQVPGGWAAQRWGGQRTLALSFGLWSTASILTTTDASKTQPIVFARVMVGVAQGLVIPSIHTVLSQVSILRGSVLRLHANVSYLSEDGHGKLAFSVSTSGAAD